jgi:hypothetical protein
MVMMFIVVLLVVVVAVVGVARFDVITDDAAVVVIIAANAMPAANDVKDEYYSSLLSSVLFSFQSNSREIKVLERELKNDRLVVAVLIVPLVLSITTGLNVYLSCISGYS